MVHSFNFDKKENLLALVYYSILTNKSSLSSSKYFTSLTPNYHHYRIWKSKLKHLANRNILYTFHFMFCQKQTPGVVTWLAAATYRDQATGVAGQVDWRGNCGTIQCFWFWFCRWWCELSTKRLPPFASAFIISCALSSSYCCSCCSSISISISTKSSLQSSISGWQLRFELKLFGAQGTSAKLSFSVPLCTINWSTCQH